MPLKDTPYGQRTFVPLPSVAVPNNVVASVTAGAGVNVNNTDPANPVVSATATAITTDAKHLAADVTGIGALQTILTSAVLGTGTWLVTYGAELHENTAALAMAIRMDVGTAVATFEGNASASDEDAGKVGAEPTHLTCTALVTITTAGTLVFRAMFSGGTGVARAVTEEGGYPNATGYVAVKLA